MDLYDNYLYGVLDEYNSDNNFVFCEDLGEECRGAPLAYYDVYAAFKEVEKKTGSRHKQRLSYG